MSAHTETQIRPEIRSMLGRLRSRIRQYVLVDAAARIVALLGVLFWLSFGMNWAWFKLSNLELPVGFRMAFDFVSIAGSLVFAGWLIAPLLRLMRDKALALVLERRFPELDDRLITAVEVAENGRGHHSDLTAHMLQNTIDSVSQTVDRLHIGDVFETRPRRRALTMAFVMAVSIGALALVNVNAMKLWAAAYIDLDEVYWDRQTTILIKVIAQPGDREKDFLDDEGRPTQGHPGVYKHPRDEELVLAVEVPRKAEPLERLAARQRSLLDELKSLPAAPGDKAGFERLAEAQQELLARVDELPPAIGLPRAGRTSLERALAALRSGQGEQATAACQDSVAALEEQAAALQADDWKVPERIELDYRLANGRGTTSVTLHRKAGGRRFLHSIRGLSDSIEALYVKGGDFANRRPYRVDVVDPPGIDRIVLESDYPDYTRRDVFDLEGRPVREHRVLRGRQTSLPLETNFLLHAFGNKPLAGVRLQADVNEGDVKDIEVRLKPFRPDAAGSIRLIVTALDGKRQIIDLPPESAWRFRLIPAEMELARKFARIVRAVEEIRESQDGDGNTRRLTHETAADGLEQLQKLAKDSQAVAQAYQKLLKEMDRNDLYPRPLLQQMRTAILDPLAEINASRFPAAERLLQSLSQADADDGDLFDQTVAARKEIEVMLVAMNKAMAEMSDGARFDVPFHIGSRALDQLAHLSPENPAPIPLPPDRDLRIYLEDTDDIIGTNPARLTINGTVDEPPIVETRLRGISTAITHRASIPVTGLIRDDYGIVTARFEFRVDANQPDEEAPADEEAAGAGVANDEVAEGDEVPPAAEEQPWRVRQFRTRPTGNPLEFVLQRSPDDRYPAARFEVLPLDLKIGQQLTLTVYAEDGDDLNGPHVTRGEKYRFRIVSNEELLSLLYGRELGIRRRFERIISEVEETRDDLALHRDRLDEAESLRADAAANRDQLDAIDVAVANAAGRSFHQVSKNHVETQDVAQSFRELLEELTNNGVHTDEQVNRIEALIVLPLDQITEHGFPDVLTNVNLFKQAHEKGADSRGQIGDSIEAVDALLARMRQVLAEMEDLVEFHEALKDLELIIQQQSELEKAAREKQKKDAIEKLKRLGLD